jgi:hypothetical protein
MVAVSLSAVERLYLVHGNSYPAWLATRYVPVSETTPRVLSEVHEFTCRGNELVQVFAKQSQYVFRCGDFWPFARTLVVPRNSAAKTVLEVR